MQHDRLSASGHLDRAIRIAGIGDVGGIGARAEWWLARHELERLAALEGVTDPVGFRSDLPGIRKEPPSGCIGDAMPAKSGTGPPPPRHLHPPPPPHFPNPT